MEKEFESPGSMAIARRFLKEVQQKKIIKNSTPASHLIEE
jgi:hypothetical protein